jgi:hypothetical protein
MGREHAEAKSRTDVGARSGHDYVEGHMPTLDKNVPMPEHEQTCLIKYSSAAVPSGEDLQRLADGYDAAIEACQAALDLTIPTLVQMAAKVTKGTPPLLKQVFGHHLDAEDLAKTAVDRFRRNVQLTRNGLKGGVTIADARSQALQEWVKLNRASVQKALEKTYEDKQSQYFDVVTRRGKEGGWTQAPSLK